jgi:hypothetical protein
MVHFYVSSRNINCYTNERLFKGDTLIYDKHELEITKVFWEKICPEFREEYPNFKLYYELKYKVKYPTN